MNLKVITWMKTHIQATDNLHTINRTTKTIITTRTTAKIMTQLEVEVVEHILRIIEVATGVDTIIITTQATTDNFCIHNQK